MPESFRAIPVPGSKRRRMKDSCDICKQRKIRCDSSRMPGGRCSNCIAFNSDCTHHSQTTFKAGPSITPLQKVGPSKPPSLNTGSSDNSDNDHVVKAHVAAIISQMTACILDADLRQVLLDVAYYARHLEQELVSLRRPLSLTVSESPANSSKDESACDDDISVTLTEHFERFLLDSYRNRFFGKSSHMKLIKTAMVIKENLNVDHQQKLLPPTRRPQFWRSSWEHDDLSPREVLPPLIFPDPDLLRSLVSIYFTRVNILLCLLHRPTFEKSLSAGLHFVDRQFGATVLAVCAVAAKYSDDPRVLLEGTNSQLSSGWKYLRQLQLVRTSLIETPTLYEVQLTCLSILYLQGSSAPEGCWVLGGAGMRYVQDMGVHRRHRYDDKVVAENWKRAFWMLICIDTLGSAFCGRPRATCSDDYDLDYPVECDDEYWETPDPDLAFKQPPGKPSILSFTVAYLKLLEIIGMSQKTIYAVRKENKPEGWTQTVVAELDAALNAWVDTIPGHLRWDPHMEDPVFAAQSSVLYACYYHVQIQVHRIFIVSPHSKAAQPISSSYPSLAICANSARSCSHIMDVAARRGFVCTPHVLNAICDSGVVLLLNVWGGRKVGLSTDPQKCLQDVETCLRLLRMYEMRWQVAGRQHDIITELMSATKMEQFVPNQLKRALNFSEDYDCGPSTIDDSELDAAGSSQTAGVNRVPLTQPGLSSGLSIADIDPLFTLPKYTEDLGRLPVYEPFHWTKDSQDRIFSDEYQDFAVHGRFHSRHWTLLIHMRGANVDLGGDSVAAPTGMARHDWNEWGSYITNMEELIHALDNPIEHLG
ncbi:fungal-specific transcription factor domain-containing protein [Mycena vulgaris]|nr:fungal-specific transcription factor domain-containing protein [Mycena vulgaris]